MAAGNVSETSMHAVNGSQLHATNERVTTTETNISNIQNDVTDMQGSVTNIQGDITNLQESDALSVKYDGESKDVLTLESGEGGTIVKNVAASEVSETSMDAVNGSQLHATNERVAATETNITNLQGDVTNIHGDITGLQQSDVLSVKYDSTSYDTITLAGGETGTTRITNLKAGEVSETSTDAVNGSQLHVTNERVAANETNITNIQGDLNGLQNADALNVKYDSEGNDVITLAGGENGTVIKNVAAGDVSETSMDAVNGSQLHATNERVTATETNITNIQNDVTDIQGSVTNIQGDITSLQEADVLSVKYDGEGKDVLTLEGGEGGTVVKNVAAGEISETSTDAVNGSQLHATNERVTETETNITNIQNDVTGIQDSVTNINSSITNLQDADTLSVKYDGASQDTITLAGGETGTTRITNLTAGNVSETSTDAVNGSQLHATNTYLSNALGGGASFINGGFTVPTYVIQNNTYNNVGSAFEAVDSQFTSLKNQLNNLPAQNGKSAYEIASENGFVGSETDWLASLKGERGEKGDKGERGEQGLNGTGGGNDTNTVDGDNSSANGNNNGVTGDNSAASGNTNTVEGDNSSANGNNNAVTGDNSAGSGNTNTVDGGNSSATGNGNTVTGDNSAASGNTNTVTGDSSTATGNNNTVTGNGSHALGNDNVAKGDNITTVGNGNTSSGQDTVVLGNNTKSDAKNSVILGNNSESNRDNTVSVGSTGNERQIIHVAAGTEDTDAVNVKQMKDADLRTLESSKTYTDSRLRDLESSFRSNVGKLEDKLSAGIAGAMAIGNLAQPNTAGKSIVGVGVASYNGEQAISIGISGVSDNNKFIVKMGASADSQSNIGGAMSFNYQF